MGSRSRGAHGRKVSPTELTRAARYFLGYPFLDVDNFAAFLRRFAPSPELAIPAAFFVHALELEGDDNAAPTMLLDALARRGRAFHGVRRTKAGSFYAMPNKTPSRWAMVLAVLVGAAIGGALIALTLYWVGLALYY